ncbi:hypothetical protein LguiA_022730 [Lonicera macranthoides]
MLYNRGKREAREESPTQMSSQNLMELPIPTLSRMKALNFSIPEEIAFQGFL